LAWLERTPTGDPFARRNGHDAGKLQTVAGAQVSGLVDPSLTPTDIRALVTAMAVTWSPASITHAASSTKDTAIHARHRRALSDSVRRAFHP